MAMRIRHLVMYLVTFAALVGEGSLSAHACKITRMGHCLQDAIANAADHIGPRARDSFTSAMHTVYQDDLVPLVDKVNSMILADVANISATINSTAQSLLQATTKVIDDAALQAGKLVGNVTRSVQIIIRTAETSLEDVIAQFFKDVDNVLMKIEKIVQGLNCLEATTAEDLREGIEKTIPSFPPPQSTWCWKNCSLSPTMSVRDLEPADLYAYRKCKRLSRLTPESSVDLMLRIYSDGQLEAATFRCIGQTRSAPTFQDYMTKEWLQWGVWYNIWKQFQNDRPEFQKVTVPLLKDDSRKHVDSSEFSRTSMSLTDRTQSESIMNLSSTEDYPCGTAFECFQSATAKCESAREECDYISSAVSSSEDALEQRVNARNSLLNKSVEELNTFVEELQTKNKEMEAQLQSMKSTLSDLQEFKNTMQKYLLLDHQGTGHGVHGNGIWSPSKAYYASLLDSGQLNIRKADEKDVWSTDWQPGKICSVNNQC